MLRNLIAAAAAALVVVGAWPASAQVIVTPRMVSAMFAGAKISVALPVPVSMMFPGDSRQVCGAPTRSGGAKLVTATSTGNVGAYCGWFPLSINNVVLDSVTTGRYGVASSTSLALSYNSTSRLYDQGSRSANVATTGNGAGAITSVSADNQENANALGVDPTTGLTVGPLTDPANIAVYLDNINDLGAAYYSSASVTETVEAANVDLLLGQHKVVFLLDSVPQGFPTVIAERHTPSAGAVTATNSTNFLAWDVFGANSLGAFTNGGVVDGAGTVYTKVASCGVTGQYTLSGNVFTFCGTAPTTDVFVNYTWGTAPSASNAQLIAVHQWEDATLPIGRPNLKIVRSYDAIADPADVTNHYALPGTMDSLNKHPTMFAAQKVADAFKTTFQAAYPGVTASLEAAPVANNWFVCNTNAVATNYSSTNCPTAGTFTLPAYNGSRCPGGAGTTAGGMWVVVNGVLRAKSDGAGGWVDQGQTPAVTGGSYNCSTGAWSLTFASAFANNLKFELLQDPLSAVDNGLFDANQGATVALPSGVTAAAGVTGTPKGWTMQIVDTCLQNSLAGTGMPAGETMSITVNTNAGSSPATVTDEDGTWPAITVTLSGIADGTGCATNSDSTITFTSTMLWPSLFFPATPVTGERGTLRAKTDAGANGHLYGTGGAYLETVQNVTGTWTPAWASAAVTAVTVDSLKSTALQPFTDMSLYNGAVTQKQVTPFWNNLGMSGAGASWTNNGSSKVVVNVGQKVPVSATFTLWRNRVRVATQ